MCSWPCKKPHRDHTGADHQASFRRIQFTPDLLPGNLIGTLIYNPKTGDFSTKKDRSPSAITLFCLMILPFMVRSTQNPIEQEGTYPLPEARVDRFMLKLKVTYSSKRERQQILRLMASSSETPGITSGIGPEDIRRLRGKTDRIYMDRRIEEYVVNLG